MSSVIPLKSGPINRLDASGGSIRAKGKGERAKGKEFAPPRQLKC
jgi:hypothetical protein